MPTAVAVADAVAADVEQVARDLGVDPSVGLSADEAASRLAAHEPNRLAGGAKEPAIAIFIGAGIFGIAGGAPLNPLQILWLNMVVDIPLAIALGFDQPARGLMGRPPRPVGAPVLSRNDWIRLCVQGAVMTIGSLAAYQIGDHAGDAVLAATMLLTTLSVFHVFAALLSRDQTGTIFDRDAVPDAMQLRRYGVAVLAILLVTSLDFLQRIFGTTALDFGQWCTCIGIALSIVVVEELVKLGVRRAS